MLFHESFNGGNRLEKVEVQRTDTLLSSALHLVRYAIHVSTFIDPETEKPAILAKKILPNTVDRAVDDLTFEHTDVGLMAMQNEVQLRIIRMMNMVADEIQQKNLKRTLSAFLPYIIHPIKTWKEKLLRDTYEKSSCQNVERDRIESIARLDLLSGLLHMALEKTHSLRDEPVQNPD